MRHPSTWAETARVFLGLSTVLGRLALGPDPIGVLGLDRLVKVTEPEPMVPTKPT